MKFLELSTMTNRFFCLTKHLFGDSQGSVAALRLRGGITTYPPPRPPQESSIRLVFHRESLAAARDDVDLVGVVALPGSI